MSIKRMPSRSADSWLLSKHPPFDPKDNGLGWDPGDALLWWAVVVQAAHDVLSKSETTALDAGEWLKDSGAHLVEALYGIPVTQTREALARLIQRSPGFKRRLRGLRDS